MDSIQLLFFVFLTIVLLIAAINDIRFQRIPNWLTYPAILIAVAYHSVIKGFEGFLFSLEGMGLGIAVLIAPYLIGKVGAGDTKLMGVIGGLLGPQGVLLAFLFSTMTGGIYTLLFLTFNRFFKNFAKSDTSLLRDGRTVLTYAKKEIKLCYAVPIAFGTLFYVIWGWTI